MTADPDPDRPPMGITVWVWVNGQGKTNLSGLFKRGIVPDEEYYNMGMNRDGNAPLLPNHGMPDNQDGNQGPVGTGIAVLAALGGAYLIGKRRKQE